ncbi:low molecular weight protein-tyrosine-phosphatase [Aliikangiella sp. IMCC44653]
MRQSILFVCLGNICRSPTAEGIFRKVACEQSNLDLFIDSAGTSAHHQGESPDPRSVEAAKQRGYDLTGIRSRQVTLNDFEEFDLLIAMDKNNYQALIDLAARTSVADAQQKVKLFLDYADQKNFSEVPDPYYGGANGFNLVIDLIEDASRGLLKSIT